MEPHAKGNNAWEVWVAAARAARVPIATTAPITLSALPHVYPVPCVLFHLPRLQSPQLPGALSDAAHLSDDFHGGDHDDSEGDVSLFG